MINSRVVWIGNVTYMGDKRHACKVLAGKHKGK
jgi:hypothetical protein